MVIDASILQKFCPHRPYKRGMDGRGCITNTCFIVAYRLIKMAASIEQIKVLVETGSLIIESSLS